MLSGRWHTVESSKSSSTLSVCEKETGVSQSHISAELHGSNETCQHFCSDTELIKQQKSHILEQNNILYLQLTYYFIVSLQHTQREGTFLHINGKWSNFHTSLIQHKLQYILKSKTWPMIQKYNDSISLSENAGSITLKKLGESCIVSE